MSERRAPAPNAESPGGRGLDMLLTATARGEIGAFELLYEQMSVLVYSVILAVLRDRAQSEEVAQEVFVEIWQLSPRFDAGKGSAIKWMTMIARRRAIDRVRHAVATADLERRTALLRSPDHDGDEDEAFEHELLGRCLSGLSALQREAVELAFYGGYTHSQVAGLLGVPLGTAKTRIRDGLTRLRSAMLDGAATEPVRPAVTMS